MYLKIKLHRINVHLKNFETTCSKRLSRVILFTFFNWKKAEETKETEQTEKSDITGEETQ